MLGGKAASRIVQGTEFFKDWDAARAADLLDAAVEHGCNIFDTAHDYGKGICERHIGTWLRRRHDRKNLVLITKGCHPWNEQPRVTPEAIRHDLAESLDRLGVEEIDVYLLHRDDEDKPVAPIMDELHRHVAAGQIRTIGASNWRIARIAEANAYAQANGLTPFTSVSPHFSLAEPLEPPWPGCTDVCGAKHAADRSWLTANKIPVLAWAALGLGLFAGRWRAADPASFPGDCRRVFGSAENFARLARLEELAAKKNAAVPQLALAYALHQTGEFLPIVSGRTPDEIATNLAAAQIRLTAPEMTWLETGR